MGLTFRSNGSKIELSGGYGMFIKIRTRIARAWDKEFGEQYSKLLLFDKMLQEEWYQKCWDILGSDRFKNEDKSLADFMFATDCGGRINYKTCKKIFDLIKDTKDDVVLRYTDVSNNDWEDFKQLLKDCYSQRSNLIWH